MSAATKATCTLVVTGSQADSAVRFNVHDQILKMTCSYFNSFEDTDCDTMEIPITNFNDTQVRSFLRVLYKHMMLNEHELSASVIMETIEFAHFCGCEVLIKIYHGWLNNQVKNGFSTPESNTATLNNQVKNGFSTPESNTATTTNVPTNFINAVAEVGRWCPLEFSWGDEMLDLILKESVVAFKKCDDGRCTLSYGRRMHSTTDVRGRCSSCNRVLKIASMDKKKLKTFCPRDLLSLLCRLPMISK